MLDPIQWFIVITSILSGSVVATILIVFVIKRIPNFIEETYKQFLDLRLKKELSEFNSKLTTNIELLKIIKSNIEPEKIKAFIKFTNYYADVISGKTKTIMDSTELKRFNVGAARNLFFFSSDETIKEYQKMREYVLSKSSVVGDPKVVEYFGALIVQMRKDIGYKDTICTPIDFTSLIMK